VSAASDSDAGRERQLVGRGAMAPQCIMYRGFSKLDDSGLNASSVMEVLGASRRGSYASSRYDTAVAVAVDNRSEVDGDDDDDDDDDDDEEHTFIEHSESVLSQSSVDAPSKPFLTWLWTHKPAVVRGDLDALFGQLLNTIITLVLVCNVCQARVVRCGSSVCDVVE
jgi:hypothetical protein